MLQPTLEELKEWRAHPVTKFLDNEIKEATKTLLEDDCSASDSIEEIAKKRLIAKGFIQGLGAFKECVNFNIDQIELKSHAKKQDEAMQSNFTKNNHFRSKPEGYIK